MTRQHGFSIALCAVVLAAVPTAFAGEVKGPPGSQANDNTTGAPANANSDCAYSGLNDFDPEEGQNASIVQTVADAWKFYGLPHGFPGTAGACQGGTNLSRDK